MPPRQVRATSRHRRGGHPSVGPLPDVLLGERNRLFDHAGVDEPDPTDVHEGDLALPIDDARSARSTTTRRQPVGRSHPTPEPFGRRSKVGAGDRHRRQSRRPRRRVALTTVSDLRPLIDAAAVRLRAHIEAEVARSRPVRRGHPRESRRTRNSSTLSSAATATPGGVIPVVRPASTACCGNRRSWGRCTLPDNLARMPTTTSP